MRNLLLILLSLFSIGGSAKDLAEFSTSMDLDELAVVLKYLRKTDPDVAEEIAVNLDAFRLSSSFDESREFNLKSTSGQMILEREDELAVGIYVFTDPEVQRRMDAAFDLAAEELGI